MGHPNKALYILLLPTSPCQTMGAQSASTSLSSANGIIFTLRQEAIISPLVDVSTRLMELVERKCEEGRKKATTISAHWFLQNIPLP